MARKKANELTAGIFVVLCLIIALGVVVWLGSATLFHRPAQQAAFIVAIDKGPVGLSIGDSVVINDYAIGKIVAVVPAPPSPADSTRPATQPASPPSMLYLADITDAKWVLHADAKAHAEAAAIGSGQLVVTDPGTQMTPLAGRDNPIPLSRGGLMGTLAAMSERLDAELDAKNKEALMGKIHAMVDSLQQVARDATRISASLAMETDVRQAQSVLAKVHASIDELKALAANLNSESDAKKQASLMAKIHHAADDAVKSVANISSIVSDAEPKIKRSLSAVTETAEQFRDYTKTDIGQILVQVRQASTKVLKISTDLSDVTAAVRQVVVMNQENLDEMIDNLTQVSVNLKSASTEIRRKPWRLLYTPDLKELNSQNIYDAAAAFSSGASQLDQAISKLTSLRKANPQGLPANDPMLIKINKDLMETFSRFSKAEQALFKELSK